MRAERQLVTFSLYRGKEVAVVAYLEPEENVDGEFVITFTDGSSLTVLSHSCSAGGHGLRIEHGPPLE